MKQILVLSILFAISAVTISCGKSAQTVQTNANTSSSQPSDKSQTVIAHSSENRSDPAAGVPVNSGQKTKWTQSGNPIDTKEFDAAIVQAEKAAKAKPSDEAAKKALNDAYFQRGEALTKAKQYASALGDFRRALKYDPQNIESKEWIEQIIKIYDSMNKDYPKEGEEPPPLPYKGEK